MMELYKLYYSREQAEAVGAVLDNAGIRYQILATRKQFDPSYAFNAVDPEVNLMLNPQDFSQANEVLKTYYARQVDDVDPGYYLFAFSDRELVEIIRRQDEWGAFDIALSRRILHDRGIEITDEADAISAKQRVAELSEPEDAPIWMYIVGYFFALAGGFVGFIIGLHGRIMMILGGLLFITYVLLGLRRSLR
jgi:hypothetical protein